MASILRVAMADSDDPAGCRYRLQRQREADYRDFGYLALTIGMTYQVSDTNLTTKAVRRTATRHALLAFPFGSVIVALLINTVASLLR